MFSERSEECDTDSFIEYNPDDCETDSRRYDCNSPMNVSDITEIVPTLQCDFVSDSVGEHVVYAEDESESAEEILVCSICFAQYSAIDRLKEHMIDVHKLRPIVQKEKAYDISESIATGDCDNADDELDNCDSDETTATDGILPVPFKELKMQLMRSFIYKCSVKGCFYKFESREKQEQHLKCHCCPTGVEKTRNFKCIECSSEIKTWRNCSAHLWKDHKIDVDLLKCPICTYKTVTSVKIWRHMRVHGKWRSKVIKKKHPSKENKDKGTTTRWYSQKICQVCGRTFANSKNLSKHVKAVHNKIKPFICNVCGRKSARKSTWIVHMRQHTGEKPFLCKTCPFKASDPSVLKKHEMRHINLSKYKCDQCEYSSIQSSSLKNHVKVYHPDHLKNISCSECNYISVNSELLADHKKDHKKGLIQNEDSSEAMVTTSTKSSIKSKQPEKSIGNVEISSDCFLPLESTDSIAHDPSIDTGGVTIPAHSEDTQFPHFMHS